MGSSDPTNRIRDAIRSRAPELLRRAEQLIARASQLLPHTLSTFPSGTDHGPQHTITVEQIASMLVTDDLLTKLSDDELFFLLLGCHYHDLGMVGTEADNATVLGREQVRREHAVSIARRITESWSALGFEDENEAGVLGDICRGHRPARNTDGRASWDDLDENRILGPGRSIRLRLLSAIVYASDELHIGADRAPERVAQWKQIVSEESRPHWDRHAEITGPAVIQDRLAFDIQPRTLALEEDLRRHVLRKALLAVDDLKRQAEAEALTTPTRPVVLRWRRSYIWELLVVHCLADDLPLGQQEIVERVFAEYETWASTKTGLAELCEEGSQTAEAIKPDIGRTVEELVRLGRLSADGSAPPRCVLASTGRESRWAIDLTKAADAEDRRCRGPYAADHEFRLLRARYGKRYVADVVTPIVKQAYSVDLSLEKADSPIRLLVEKSPTACRLVSDIAPMPSGLVKREMLAGGVLIGFFIDVLRDPELLLDSETRRTARTLVRSVADQLPGFLSFLEELALIGGWSMEQISGVLAHTGDSPAMNQPNTGAGATVTVSQTLPRTYPASSTGFAYFVLAGLRSGVTVSLLDRPESRLEIDVPDQLVPGRTGTSGPAMLTLGPPKGVPAARFDLRCRIELDVASNVVHLLGYDLGEPEAAARPLVVEVCPPLRFPEETTGKATLSPRPGCMTVADLAGYLQMCQLMAREGAELQVIRARTGQAIAEMRFPPTEPRVPMDFVQPELLAALLAIDPQIPIPLFIRKQDAAAIIAADPGERPTVYRQIIDTLGKGKRDITTLYLVRESASGMAYQEEFLGFLPKSPFNCPTLNDPAKQALAEDEWRKRETIMAVTCYMVSSAEEIAQAMIRWAEDRSPPFPAIRIWKDDPVPHHCKAISQTEFLPAVDRQWYRELPIRVVVRPLSRAEELEVEAAYWQSVGDTRRAELAGEKLRVVREAGGPGNGVDGSKESNNQTDAPPSKDEK